MQNWNEITEQLVQEHLESLLALSGKGTGESLPECVENKRWIAYPSAQPRRFDAILASLPKHSGLP